MEITKKILKVMMNTSYVETFRLIFRDIHTYIDIVLGQ